MRVYGAVFALASVFLSGGLLSAAESMSADVLAKQAQSAFQSGEFKKSAKFLEKAVQLDSTNADYRDALGKAYEREAESASFPLVLSRKARNSFVRALELQPNHAGAMEGLIELAQQPIGLCEGDLAEASALIDRLEQVDPVSAMREREYFADAKHESSRPGQRVLCGPVKVSRAITDHILPNTKLQTPAPKPADAAILAERDFTPGTSGGTN